VFTNAFKGVHEGVTHTPLGVKHVGKTDGIRKVGSTIKLQK